MYNRSRQVKALNKAQKARDVAPSCPDIKYPLDRIKCDKSLLYFAKRCFPHICKLQFGELHKQYLKNLQDIFQNGGLQALSVTRGGGKSSLAQIGIIWAVLTGRRKFPLYVTATAKMSKKAIKNIKSNLCYSGVHLYDLYPQQIHAFRSLKGSGRKALSQTWNDELTGVEIGQMVIFGKSGGMADGGIIATASATSNFRGLNHQDQNGTYRPDIIVIDDLMSNQAAKSIYQCANLQDIIQSDILGLAGPDVQMAAIFIGTPLIQGDLVQIFLGKKMWNGKKYPLMYEMPKDKQAMQKFKNIFLENKEQAKKFYIENKEKFADGKPSWEARKHKEDVDAIHYALRKWASNESSFKSEYQLQPKTLHQSYGASTIDPNFVNKNSNGRKLGQFNKGQTIVVGIDINEKALSYQVMDQNYSIIDYGIFPKQRNELVKIKEIEHSISKAFPASSLQESISQAMESLIKQLYQKYGQSITLIDNSYALTATVMFQLARKLSPQYGIVINAMGRYVRVTDKPIWEWKNKKGQIVFPCGRLTQDDNGNVYIVHDPNYSKSNISRLIESGKLTVYSGKHTLLQAHLTSEYFKDLESAMRQATEWKIIPGQTENHLLDATVLCYVGLQYLGQNPIQDKPQKPKKSPSKQNLRIVDHSQFSPVSKIKF